MSPEYPLGPILGRLLGFGTLLCSVIIGLGVLLRVAGITTPGFELTTIGIIGFIALPVLRLATMWVIYLRLQDRAMIPVVLTVLCFVFVGLIAGIIW